MACLKELGKVYTSDILVIGGGFAGLCTAIRAKEVNPDLDVLIVERCYTGWSGQATKAGNGIVAHTEQQDIGVTTKWMTENQTPYINDQELLYDYLSTNTESVEWLRSMGCLVSENEDGSIKMWPCPESNLAICGIELSAPQTLRKVALEMGVRILNCVNVFELLTNNGVVCGAVGFDMDYMKYHIFHAKAVAVATHGAQFKKLGREFMGYGTGIGMAYRAGAYMRNAEFSTQIEIVFKGTNVPVYGGFNLIHNQLGENISMKYAPNAPEIGIPLLKGMVKEVEEGRGPLYVDLRVPDETLIAIGWEAMQFGDGRLMPDKLAWEAHVEGKSNKYTMEHTLTPEITIDTRLQNESLRVNRNFKTDVEGLWAPGKISYQGSAYFGWHRGDGVGNAAQTGVRAGKDMAEFATTHELLDIDVAQVEALKEKLYAPLNRPTDKKPSDIFDKIETYGFGTHKLILKSQEAIDEVLADIEEMRKMIPELTAYDAHSLAKCHEAVDSLLCLEAIFRCANERKESRGLFYPHYREDYPEQDDKNWLKWISVHQGADGNMEVVVDDIPMWKYPHRPEGYVIPEGQVEEYYV